MTWLPQRMREDMQLCGFAPAPKNPTSPPCGNWPSTTINPPSHHAAMAAIEACRTEALVWHVYS